MAMSNGGVSAACTPRVGNRKSAFLRVAQGLKGTHARTHAGGIHVRSPERVRGFRESHRVRRPAELLLKTGAHARTHADARRRQGSPREDVAAGCEDPGAQTRLKTRICLPRDSKGLKYVR